MALSKVKKVSKKKKESVKNKKNIVQFSAWFYHLRALRQQGVHKTGKLSRKTELPKLMRLPAWWKLFGRSVKIVVSEWRTFFPLLLIFVVLAWLVNGVYSLDALTNLKTVTASLSDTFGIFEQSILGTVGLIGAVFSGFQDGSADSSTQMLMNIIFILAWLAVLWIARYALARQKTTLRDAIYKSGSAFLPTVLIIFIMIFELLPLAGAFLIFGAIGTGSIFDELIARAFLGILGTLLILVSVYFLTSSMIALQIVSLPGMYPWRALRSAKRLIVGRRFVVFRKLFALIICSLIVWIALILPVILIDNLLCSGEDVCVSTTWIVPFFLFAISSIILTFGTISIYLLYRALLEKNEANE